MKLQAETVIATAKEPLRDRFYSVALLEDLKTIQKFVPQVNGLCFSITEPEQKRDYMVLWCEEYILRNIKGALCL